MRRAAFLLAAGAGCSANALAQDTQEQASVTPYRPSVSTPAEYGTTLKETESPNISLLR